MEEQLLIWRISALSTSSIMRWWWYFIRQFLLLDWCLCYSAESVVMCFWNVMFVLFPRLAKYTQFKNFQKRILVATNLFGRGMDIERVNIVFNYDMPENSDTYLHRVSRLKYLLDFPNWQPWLLVLIFLTLNLNLDAVHHDFQHTARAVIIYALTKNFSLESCVVVSE